MGLKRSRSGILLFAAVVFLLQTGSPLPAGQDLLEKLGRKQTYTSRRVSSFDRSGGNRDALSIEPGETAVLAEIPGPAVLHHIWVTIAAESFYGPDGTRFPVLLTEKAEAGTRANLIVPLEISDRYTVDLYFLQGPAMGNIRAAVVENGKAPDFSKGASLEGYAPQSGIAKLTLENALLKEGRNSIFIEVVGKKTESTGMEMGFIGLSLAPAAPRFITEWNLIGPFNAPDMTHLQTPYPPENELLFEKSYPGKDGKFVPWALFKGEQAGYVRLEGRVKPDEQALVYGLVYVHSPREISTPLLLGSDDGVRVWLNGKLVHSNPAYRGAYPDQDIIRVRLQKGWNTLLVKVLQGTGGWGFYVRFADPEDLLRWSTEPK